MEPTKQTNALGQPIGAELPDWRPPPHPKPELLAGRTARLEALDPGRHGEALYRAFSEDRDGRDWTYLPYGPFDSRAEFDSWLAGMAGLPDPLFLSVVDPESDEAVGVASYLRIVPEIGSIEIGHLHFSDRMKRRPISTEALFLLMQNAFALGYRRLEWKCDALNEPSRNAALRLGFRFEGVFRQHTITKGRNRDTAWFAIVDGEWPRLETAFTRWLDPANFDARGEQRERLGDLVAAATGDR